jgi:hypothetical protein
VGQRYQGAAAESTRLGRQVPDEFVGRRGDVHLGLTRRGATRE